MGTTLMKVRSDPAELSCLNDREYRFAHEYIRDYNGSRAAQAAGVSKKCSSVSACKMLKRTRIKNAIRYLDRRTLEECKLDAVNVRQRIAMVLMFKPARYFHKGGNGGWFTDRTGLDRLPDWVHEMIVEIQKKTVVDNDGDTTEAFWLKFMNKDKALELAARYTLTETFQSANMLSLDWDRLIGEDVSEEGVKGENNDDV